MSNAASGGAARGGVEAPVARGERQPLSRRVILTAALQLIDNAGLQAMTMRRLAHELGYDPMSLYRHVGNRDAVLDGVAEVILEQLIPPEVGTGQWQDQLRRTATDFRALALAHPHTVPLLATRPLSTPMGLRPPGTLRPMEYLLAVLTGAGFTPAAALHAYRAYFGLLYGHILNAIEEFVVDDTETDHLLRLGLHRLPVNEFPHIRGLAAELGHYDGAAELATGLEMLITGLQANLKTTTS